MGTFFVYNDAYVGKCYWTEKRSRATGVFTYDEEYLSGNDHWNIDPALSLISGAQTSGSGLPGTFRDATPDRWGQTLIRQRHLRENKKHGGPARALSEVDYLLGVSDRARQGNLRFSLEKGGAFLHPSDDIPKLVALPKLLDAAHRYTAAQDESAIKYLLDTGSASLGGARPKAAVMDGDDLYIAKFPHRQDQWDVMAWEWAALSVAAEAGIAVPENRLVDIEGQNVLLVKRFDRSRGKRIAYISAMTLLGLTDGEQADYSEITEKLRDVSVSAKEDLMELYRRIALSLYLNNTDDHLRNHGLLRSGSGWRLSPVFDINPNPEPAAARGTSVFGELEKEPALTALTENADTFGLTEQEASKILSVVSTAARSCEKYAVRAGVKKSEREFILRTLGM